MVQKLFTRLNQRIQTAAGNVLILHLSWCRTLTSAPGHFLRNFKVCPDPWAAPTPPRLSPEVSPHFLINSHLSILSNFLVSFSKFFYPILSQVGSTAPSRLRFQRLLSLHLPFSLVPSNHHLAWGVHWTQTRVPAYHDAWQASPQKLRASTCHHVSFSHRSQSSYWSQSEA